MKTFIYSLYVFTCRRRYCSSMWTCSSKWTCSSPSGLARRQSGLARRQGGLDRQC
ncbi:hypothetical protein ACS0TY_013054 [Phlomoides rotata]